MFVFKKEKTGVPVEKPLGAELATNKLRVRESNPVASVLLKHGDGSPSRSKFDTELFFFYMTVNKCANFQIIVGRTTFTSEFSFLLLESLYYVFINELTIKKHRHF